MIPHFNIGDRLRKSRETTGMDQAAFADAIGVSRQSITNWETGKHAPKRIVLNAWSMATGVPEEWLRTGVVPEREFHAAAMAVPEKLPHLDSNQKPAD